MNVIQHTHNLVGRYCQAVLRNDKALFADTWAENAQWHVPGQGAIEGRADIVSVFVAIRSTYRLCVQEILSGTVDAIDEQTATAVWQVRELQWKADGTGHELIGVYSDRIARGRDDIFRFTDRAFELIYDGAVNLGGRLRLKAAN